MSAKGSKRKRQEGLSLDALKQMGVKQLIEALKQEGIIAPDNSLETSLSEGEINGNGLVLMCRWGYERLVQLYGFKPGHAIQLEEMYLRLQNEGQEKKQSKTPKKHIQDQLQKYRDRLNSIRNAPITKDQLADPEVRNWFPYPFLGVARPGTRFIFRENDEVYYEGRKEFSTILAKVRDLRLVGEAGRGLLCKELYLNGTLGYGKSHFMCAIAFWLLKDGERVVYLPEAKGLIRAEVQYIRHAFRLTFADDEEILGEVELCKSKEDFEALAMKLAGSGIRIYFLLDQANAFDDESGVSGAQTSVRREKLDWIDRVTSEHFLILSASGNYQKAAIARQKVENVTKLDFFGGLDKEEMAVWWKRSKAEISCLRSPLLSKDFESELEYRSGNNPLLLRGVVEALEGLKETASESDLQATLWFMIIKNKHWRMVEEQIFKFVMDAKFRGRDWAASVLQVMEAGIQNTVMIPGSIEMMDGRHFQVMEDNTIKAASGHVQAIAALCLRQFKGQDLFLGEDWFRILPNCGHQPSVLGFIVENIMISHLAKGSITLDNKKLGRMRIVELGAAYPSLIDPYLPLNQPNIYIPVKWNHKAIDAIIIWPDKPTLKVIAIQIAINNRHENSEVSFAPYWKDILPMRGPVAKHLPPGFSQYELIFLWIVEDPEKFRFKNAIVPAGVVKIDNVDFHHREYRRVVEGVKDICPKLVPGLERARETQQNENDLLQELGKTTRKLRGKKKIQ